MKLKIVCEVKINEKWVRKDDISPEKFVDIVEATMNRAMDNIGFDRIKTV